MTITRRGSLTGITMRGTPGTRARFAVDWVRIETVITPGDTDEQTIDDAVFEVTTPATVDHEAQAIIRPTHPDADVSQITWSTSDESIATIDASGKVTRVSDGYIRIIATDQHGATAKSGLVHIYRESGVESQTFVRWVEGSVAKAAADAIDNRIADADPQTDMAIFTTQDHANGIYVRNPTCWAADLDLTGVSPWNSRSGALRAGVAISPRDVLVSEHYPLQVGNTIRFVDGDNNTITRTIAAVKNVGPANSSDGYATDFQVCTLDEDLPEEIKYYTVLPAEWADYIRNLNIGLPTLGLDQEEKALVQDLYSLGTMAAHRTPSDAQRLAFYESKITGDSGNPSLLILDDEPVLVTLWTFGGAGSGPNIARLHDAINAAMTANGSPYQLTVADLSGWTNYADPWPAQILAKTVAYYSFEGDAEDKTGNGHDGTVSGATLTTGQAGQGYSFSTGHISVASHADLSGFDDFGVSLWIRPATVTSSQYPISVYSTSGNQRSWGIQVLSSSLRVNLSTDGTSFTASPAVSAPAVADGVWQHFVVTRSGSTVTVYKNGQLGQTYTFEGTLFTASTPLTIGDRSDLGAQFEGDVDEVAIFNAALTADDIARIYAGDHPLQGAA